MAINLNAGLRTASPFLSDPIFSGFPHLKEEERIEKRGVNKSILEIPVFS
jgi:hypothetical protein